MFTLWQALCLLLLPRKHSTYTSGQFCEVLLLSSFDGWGNGDKKVEYLVQWNTASKWQSFYLNWGSLSGRLLWSHFLFSWCSGEGGGCPERRHHGGNICPSEQSAPFPSQSDHVQPPHLIGRQHSDLKDLRTFKISASFWNQQMNGTVQFSHSVMSDTLQPHELQHARPPCHHQLPKLTQTHVHWVGDAIQPSHPLSSPSPPALNLPQHQGVFQWVSSSL